MKKIKIWADVHSTGIFNEIGAFFLKEQTKITNKTWQELLTWVEEYDIITSLDDEERENYTYRDVMSNFLVEIERCNLDKEWSNDIETNEELDFVYYSEGLMKNL